jgi:hypothetical protein
VRVQGPAVGVAGTDDGRANVRAEMKIQLRVLAAPPLMREGQPGGVAAVVVAVFVLLRPAMMPITATNTRVGGLGCVWDK